MGHRERLAALLDIGVIDEIIRPLMSGKEAEVFLVKVSGQRRVAKLYKEASVRSFKHRAEYTEGRRTRNSRQQRAMSRRSRFGREQEELAWRSAEVDAIYRLQAAGVRVPEPFEFVDGILIMELIAGIDGEPAPRLVDVSLQRDEAERVHAQLIQEIVRMLCAGLVHGDLSDFNVLMTPTGPVIIDFPQAVDAAANNNARRMLIRDVRNVTSFLARFSPKLKRTRFGEEMWALYEEGKLTPDTQLTGRYERAKKGVDLMGILDEIYAAEVEERRRREALGLEPIPERPPEQPRRRRRGGRGPRHREEQGNTPSGNTPQNEGPRRSRGRRGPNGRRSERRDDARSASSAQGSERRRRPPERDGGAASGGPSGRPRRREVVVENTGRGAASGGQKRRRRRRRGRGSGNRGGSSNSEG